MVYDCNTILPLLVLSLVCLFFSLLLGFLTATKQTSIDYLFTVTRLNEDLSLKYSYAVELDSP